MLTVVSGNDISDLLQLKKNNATFNIPNGATVKAVLVSYDRATLLAGPFTMLNTDDGADWTTSLLSLIVADTLTDGLDPAKIKLEVMVDDTDRESWFFDAEIVQGNVA